MAKKLQILRGTTAQNNAYTGSIGELTMDTEKVEVRIHDGTTQGGKTIGVTIEQLNNKVDVSAFESLRNAENFTTEGKATLSGFAMPSDKYVDLTLGASNATYVAPANGYFVLAKTSSASWQVLTFILNNTQIDNFYSFDTSIQGVLCTPVAKGDSLKINYTFGGQTDIFRFIYANGSK